MLLLLCSIAICSILCHSYSCSTASEASSCCCVQYAELAVSLWHGRLVVSGILVSLTLLSCLRTSGRTYNTRKMLVRTMDQQCLVTFVWAGRIRAVSSRR